MQVKNNILFITDVTQSGGVNTYIYNLTNFAKKNNWNITLLVDDNQGVEVLCNDLKKINTIIYKKDIRKKNIIHIQNILFKIILKHKISLVHVHCGSSRSMLEVREILLKKNISLVFTEQFVPNEINYDIETINRINKIYYNTKAIITVSENNLNIIQNRFNINNKNIYMIPNSVDIINKSCCNKKKFNKSKYKFLFMGRLVEQKGVDILLLAIGEMSLLEREKSEFHIYGEGEDLYTLKKMAKKLNIENNVFFYDWTNNPSSLYPNYDAFVLPSRNEGQPFALLEAISHCIPCIASNASGIQEVFCNNKYGTSFDVDNYLELSNILNNFVQNPYSYYAKSQLAIKFLEKKHNNEINLQKTLDIWSNASPYT